MAGRNLSPAVAAATQAENVLRTAAVELRFPIGTVRLNASSAPIIIGGEEFLGMGILGSITTAEESAELRSYGMSVKLSGIPRDMISVAFNEDYQGRRGTVWEVVMDRDTWQPLADPFIIFRGRMDQMDITLGATATVDVKLENRLADWERPRLSRYTDEDQRRLHGGDTGMRFVAATTEKDLIWPSGTWKPGSGPSGGFGGVFGIFGIS